MHQTRIAGLGSYLPENIVTNDDLAQKMNTSDAWIQERTGIRERRYASNFKETTTTMGAKAAALAIERAGIQASEIDFIIFATLSPDYYFPGCGVLVQRHLGITSTECGALDIRNQCSGFIYGLSVADQFIKTGMYRNILLVGAEMHSMGLDFSDKGRNVTVIFGDGAGAVVLQPASSPGQGILSTHLHADGMHAEKLCTISPGCHGGYHADRLSEKVDYGFPETPFGGIFVTQTMVQDNLVVADMDGQFVFKMAVQKFPQVIGEALHKNGMDPSAIDMFIPHQANLRISQFVQKQLGLPDEKVWNNIQKYGNTTAASIPVALCEAWENGKVREGDLVCLAAFGSGFTWGSALIRW